MFTEHQFRSIHSGLGNYQQLSFLQTCLLSNLINFPVYRKRKQQVPWEKSWAVVKEQYTLCLLIIWRCTIQRSNSCIFIRLIPIFSAFYRLLFMINVILHILQMRQIMRKNRFSGVRNWLFSQTHQTIEFEFGLCQPEKVLWYCLSCHH